MVSAVYASKTNLFSITQEEAPLRNIYLDQLVRYKAKLVEEVSIENF